MKHTDNNQHTNHTDNLDNLNILRWFCWGCGSPEWTGPHVASLEHRHGERAYTLMAVKTGKELVRLQYVWSHPAASLPRDLSQKTLGHKK